MMGTVAELEERIEQMQADYVIEWLKQNTEKYDIESLTRKDLIGIYTLLGVKEHLPQF